MIINGYVVFLLLRLAGRYASPFFFMGYARLVLLLFFVGHIADECILLLLFYVWFATRWTVALLLDLLLGGAASSPVDWCVKGGLSSAIPPRPCTRPLPLPVPLRTVPPPPIRPGWHASLPLPVLLGHCRAVPPPHRHTLSYSCRDTTPRDGDRLELLMLEMNSGWAADAIFSFARRARRTWT